MAKFTVELESVTPEKAARLLSNVHTRQVGRNLVTAIKSYAAQMKAGTWDESVAQTISIDKTGALVDGFHRLSAVVQSGVTVKFLIVRGVNPESFGKYDAGSARSLGFRTGHGKDEIAVINYTAYLAKYVNTKGKPTNEEIELTWEFLKSAYIEFTNKTPAMRTPRLTAAPIRAAFIFQTIRQPDYREELYSAYSNYLRRDLHDAPRSMSALSRRLLDRRHTAHEQFAVAYRAFDVGRFDHVKIQVASPGEIINEAVSACLGDLVEAICD